MEINGYKVLMVYQNLDRTRLILIFPRGQSRILGSLDPSLWTSRQQRGWAWGLVLTTIIPGTAPHPGLRVRERAGDSPPALFSHPLLYGTPLLFCIYTHKIYSNHLLVILYKN